MGRMGHARSGGKFVNDFQGVWDDATSYAAGDLVRASNGKLYVATTAPEVGGLPAAQAGAALAGAVAVGTDSVQDANAWNSGGAYGAIVFKTRSSALTVAALRVRTGGSVASVTGNVKLGLAAYSAITKGAAPSASNPTLLAATTPVASSSLSNNTWYKWDLDAPVELTADTKYALVVVTGGNVEYFGAGYNANSATETGIDVDLSTADWTLRTNASGHWADTGGNIFPFELWAEEIAADPAWLYVVG